MTRLIAIILVFVASSSWAMGLGMGMMKKQGQTPGPGAGREFTWEDLQSAMSLSPTSKDYGSQNTGTNTDQVFTLSNPGNDILEAASLNASGAAYSITSRTCGNNPFDLPSGQSCSATVRFTPGSAGTLTGSLTASAPNLADVVASLTGIGVAIGSSDNFDRANANDLGANWGTPTGLQSIKVESNQARITVNNISVQYWIGNLTNNHCSKVTIALLGSGQAGPAVRISSTADTYYHVLGTTVRRRVSGADTDVSSGGTGTITQVVNGDTQKLCISGSTLTLYRNDVLEWTKTDASPIVSGQAGIKIRYTDTRLDNWEGSQL